MSNRMVEIGLLTLAPPHASDASSRNARRLSSPVSESVVAYLMSSYCMLVKRSAARRRARSSSTMGGLGMKSSAPLSSALTTSPKSSVDDMTMMKSGLRDPMSLRAAEHTSNPEMSGNFTHVMSVRTSVSTFMQSSAFWRL